MLNRMIAATILVLASGAIGMASQAHAQKIRPECKTARDKVECTCALNAGGGIRPDGRWFLVRGRGRRGARQHRIRRLHAARGALSSGAGDGGATKRNHHGPEEAHASQGHAAGRRPRRHRSSVERLMAPRPRCASRSSRRMRSLPGRSCWMCSRLSSRTRRVVLANKKTPGQCPGLLCCGSLWIRTCSSGLTLAMLSAKRLLCEIVASGNGLRPPRQTNENRLVDDVVPRST